MNSLDYAIQETRKQYTFKTQEAAQSFKTALASVRVKGRVVLRKSLPEFKHHGNPGWSVYVTPWAFPDSVQISELAKNHGGRPWGKL